MRRLSDDILHADSIEEAQQLSTEFHQVFYEEMPVLKAGNSTGIVSMRDNIDGLQYIAGPILWNISKQN